MKRFRKVYVITIDNQIFGQYQVVNMYRDRDYAYSVCESQNRIAKERSTQYEYQDKPIPVYKVHAYHLLHEDLIEK